jgi:hypothetical protein
METWVRDLVIAIAGAVIGAAIVYFFLCGISMDDEIPGNRNAAQKCRPRGLE